VQRILSCSRGISWRRRPRNLGPRHCAGCPAPNRMKPSFCRTDTTKPGTGTSSTRQRSRRTTSCRLAPVPSVEMAAIVSASTDAVRARIMVGCQPGFSRPTAHSLERAQPRCKPPFGAADFSGSERHASTFAPRYADAVWRFRTYLAGLDAQVTVASTVYYGLNTCAGAKTRHASSLFGRCMKALLSHAKVVAMLDGDRTCWSAGAASTGTTWTMIRAGLR
jgi:hypothetical protein